MKKIYILILIVFIILLILLLRQNIAFRKDIEVNKILTKTETSMYLYDFVKTVDKSSVNYVTEFDLSLKKSMPNNAIYKMHYFLYSKNSLNRLGLEDYELLKIKDTIAFEYDIDDDGVDEIIGSNVAEPFFKDGNGEFYVLKKRDDKYSLLAAFPVNIKTKKIYILEDKTNGLHDIGQLAAGADNIDIWKAQHEEQNTYFDERNLKTNSNITDDSHIDVNSDINDILELGYIAVDYEKEGKFFEKQPILKSFHTGRDSEVSKTALNIFANYFRDEIIESMKNNDIEVTQKEIERRIKIVAEENWAVEYDLNGDNVNEIIGFKWDTCGWTACPLYVLSKQDDEKYINIAEEVYTSPYEYKLNILSSSTNGFHDIGFITGGPGNGTQWVIRYKKNKKVLE